jgi:hypothetical protein
MLGLGVVELFVGCVSSVQVLVLSRIRDGVVMNV